MTEAVRVLTEWTLKQPGAATVVSLVETDNRPSRSVMSRAGFRETCHGRMAFADTNSRATFEIT